MTEEEETCGSRFQEDAEDNSKTIREMKMRLKQAHKITMRKIQ